jgi:hypothetical protein
MEIDKHNTAYNQKDKNHRIISTDTDKTFEKNPKP